MFVYKILGLSLLISCQTIITESALIVTAQGDPSTLIQNSTTLPKGFKSFPDVNAAYKLYTEAITWYEARDRCIADNSKLAIVDSRDKIRHIVGLPFASYKRIHVGIHKSSSNTDEWVRVDNDLPVTSAPWNSEYHEYDCAGISLFGNGLIDYSCDFSDYFVCEIAI